jgi:Sulfotransferase family
MSFSNQKPRLFFIIGPLRTGSSLLARCIDDHPGVIGLCESEINRALFRDYILERHCRRMMAHGLSLEQAIILLDRKKQEDVESLTRWYSEVTPLLGELYGKRGAPVVGDKSPDFYRSPAVVNYLSSHFSLIYTVRDPRAILNSIESQDDATPEEKAERWNFLIENYLAWKPFLDSPNVLTVRYRDLVSDPAATMWSVYTHLGLPYSSRFLERFPRRFPDRFLWATVLDWETGIRKDFDASRISSWKGKLNEEQLGRVTSNPTILELMERFGYDI